MKKIFLSFFFIFAIVLNFSSCSFNIWVIADPHIDLNYTVGANPKCKESLCCRHTDPDQTEYAGLFGTPNRTCDIPPETFQKTLEYVNTHNESTKDDVILILGDYPPHKATTIKKKGVLKNFNKALEIIVEVFKGENEKQIIPFFGNHESYPIDAVCHPTNILHRECVDWILHPFAGMLKNFLDDSTVNFFNKTGFYKKKISDNIKVLTINTNWATKLNGWVQLYPYEKHHKMMEWMENELKESSKNKEKVIIAGHVATNKMSYMFDKYNEEYVNLIKKYKDIVICSIFGHEHIDRWFITRDELNKPISMSYVASSVTTFHSGSATQNPSVKLFKLDSFGKLEDILTFYNDLEISNKEKDFSAGWKLEYSMKNDYKLNDLEPNSFDELLNRMENDENVYDQFMSYHNTKNSGNTCFGKCKTEILCRTKFTDHQKYKDCIG